VRTRALLLWRVFRVGLPFAVAAAWFCLAELDRTQTAIVLSVALVASAWLSARADLELSLRLRTVSSILTAYKEGDFSIRAHPEPIGTAFGEVLDDLNDFGDTLREHRLGELEAWTLLEKVMAEIGAVVLAFDDGGRVKLSNGEAARTLGKPAEALSRETASSLGLSELLVGGPTRTIKELGALGLGPWEMRRGTFRMSGEPHTLLVLSDVSLVLREEERAAWKRLIVVMTHEINNSLSPIQSVACSSLEIVRSPQRAEDWEDDLKTGLSIVARRAEGLARFIAEYSRLARLPPPHLGQVRVAEWIARVGALERRLAVEILGGPSASLAADADQLEQLLINLVKNAVDASLERGGGVRVHWAVDELVLTVYVDDDGGGVAGKNNLFVPFFTTKPGGSGIGLVLAREIAEGHGGTLQLQTRPDASGARAILRLPMRA
jgi:two-component system nitrogen regulation sensor histidine kinase NtrY